MKNRNKVKFLILFLITISFYSYTQDIEKQESGDLAILTIRTGAIMKTKAVFEFEKNDKVIEYDEFVNKKFPKTGKLELQKKMILESFRFMLDNGYECISSNATVWGESTTIKEYIFRKK